MRKEKHTNNTLYLPDSETCLKKLKRTFPHLTDTELKILLAPDSIRAYKKGMLLHEEGSCIKGCYFIHCGIVKIYQTGPEGKEQIIQFDQEGDIFGFRSVIRHEPACTSAKTLSD